MCLQGKVEFSTTELKGWLEKYGYIYGIDYDIILFSNAMASLTKQKYIESLNSNRKGNYRVIYKDVKSENENYKERKLDKELELKDIREKILYILKKSGREIEDLLDSEKLSTYRRNHRTYDEILKLLGYLENFEFTMDRHL